MKLDHDKLPKSKVILVVGCKYLNVVLKINFTNESEQGPFYAMGKLYCVIKRCNRSCVTY